MDGNTIVFLTSRFPTSPVDSPKIFFHIINLLKSVNALLSDAKTKDQGLFLYIKEIILTK